MTSMGPGEHAIYRWTYCPLAGLQRPLQEERWLHTLPAVPQETANALNNTEMMKLVKVMGTWGCSNVERRLREQTVK